MIYKVRRSNNADSRTKDSNNIKDLEISTLYHMKDVQSVLSMLSIELQKIGINHDYTKIKYLDEFHKDWESKEDIDSFTKGDWYMKHITEERHHSNAHLHDDFNLLDLLEELADKVCAGKGRSGEIDMSYFKYDKETIEKAIYNTIILIDNMTEIEEEE